MKIMVLGCGGMLGHDVYKSLCLEYGSQNVMATDIDLNESWLSYLDVRDINAIRRKAVGLNPSVIINLAALTDLEYCESFPIEAWKTNTMGAENTCTIANEFDAVHIYISTAGIFDGEKECEYDDYDQPNPLSIYGKTKYYGEQYCLANSNRGYVFRAGWMMGGFEKDKKFIKKIIDKIKNGDSELRVVTDKFGTPTYTVDFADAITSHLNCISPYGLYNQVCGGEKCSRYDVALELVRLLGLNIPVVGISSRELENEYYAPRPRNEGLINLRLGFRSINYMRDWKICLADYIDDWRTSEDLGI